jgi:hypothetical protein
MRELAAWGRRLLIAGSCLTASAVIAACGSSTQTKTVTVAAAQTTPVTTSVEQPAAESSAPKTSARRTPKTRASATKPKAAVHTWCDANIRVKTATTTCPFAENVFLSYWASTTYDGGPVSAYSPAANREFDLDCIPGEGQVICTAGDGAEVVFSRDAVDRYSLSQAKHYVATHDVGDDIFPWETSGEDGSATSDATPSYSVPDTSSTPPGENIPNYDNGNGYRVQCADGTFSHSGGIQGACSHHGGVG